MTTTSDNWTEPEAGLVRESLLAAQGGMQVGAAPTLTPYRTGLRPSWPRIPVLVAVTVVALVMAVTGLLQPWRKNADGPAPIPATNAPAVSGELVTDSDWLVAVADRAAEQWSQSLPGQGPARGMRVLLAADITGGRFALVGWTEAGQRRQAWVMGPSGAPAREMVLGDGCSPDRVCWTRYGEVWNSGRGTPVNGHEGVVVSAPAGSRVVVRAGNDVTAAGVVRRTAVAADEPWPGIFVAPLADAGGRMDVSVTDKDGTTRSDWSYTGYTQDSDAWWAEAATDARGAGVTDGLTVRGDLAATAMQATAMPLTRDSRLLWSTGSGSRDEAVLALRGAGGGWALVAVERIQLKATSFSVAVAAIRTMAATQPGELSMAWRRRGSPEGLQLVGPVTAARVRITSGAGTVTRNLTAGVGEVRAPGATKVTFLDRAGKVVAETPVSPAWKDGQLLKP